MAWVCLAMVCVAALSWGCPTNQEPFPPDTDPGKRLGPGEPCSVDLECKDRLRCEPTRRICICTSDLACPDEQTCDPFTGRCVKEAAGCGTDAACHQGQWCDVSLRTCRPLRAFCEPCVVDAECGEGFCLRVESGELFCSYGCSNAADCPWSSNVGCEAGACVPAVSCAASAPCKPDRGTSCNNDGDCAAWKGQRCAVERGRCEAVDSGCAVGRTCDSETLSCRVPCSANARCASGETCVGCEGGGACNGFCEPTPTCRAHSDCAALQICRRGPDEEEGICIPACRADAECPIGQICVTQGVRSICRDGCKSDGDCPLSEICDEQSGSCVGGGGRCQITETCGVCESCGPDNRCSPARTEAAPHCAPCEGDDDCGGDGICQAERCLIACQEGECPRGFRCERADPIDGSPPVCKPNDGICDTECA